MSLAMNPFGLPFLPQNPGIVPPPQPIQAVTMNPVQPSPPAQINTGRWVVVKSYQDATRVTASVDGTPTICMLENEPIFYVVRNVDGRKEIGGFQFAPITNNDNRLQENMVAPQQQVQQVSSQQQSNDLQTRMVNMENSIAEMSKYLAYIKSALGEGVNNESVSSNG